MMICIGDVLSQEELKIVNADLDVASFVDGKSTAGWHARLVKNNTQLSTQTANLEDLRSRVLTALNANALFRMAALPKAIAPILFSRYTSGMSYGSHVDNALMSNGNFLIRADLSLTLFLSEPNSYEGGELVIESTQGEQSFKLAAGSLVLYPSTTLHRVEPITAGMRLVAVTWIQSLVRDPSDREILFDLDTARQILFAQYGKSKEFDLLSKSYANLLRKWIEV
jgi:PKHD-type hydroxylase